jgi:hypothetical protein
VALGQVFLVSIILPDFHFLLPSVGFSTIDPLVGAVQRRSLTPST